MADEPRDLTVQSNIASAIRSAQPITATRNTKGHLLCHNMHSNILLTEYK